MVTIDDESEPGAWADAIAHSYCMDVSDWEPSDGKHDR
jgi:hypothetical protein